MPRVDFWTRSKPSLMSLSWMLIFFCPAIAIGQVEQKETLFYLNVNEECASVEDDAYLSDAITTRIPNAFIIRNKSVVPDWSILWEKSENEPSCVLTIFRGSTQSVLTLGPKATEKEIEGAASRIVWISSFSKEEPKTTNKATDEEKKVDEKEEGTQKIEEVKTIKEKVEEPIKKEPITEKKTPPKKLQEEKKKTPFSTPLNRHDSNLTYDHIDLSLSLVPGIEFYTNETPHRRGVPAFSFNMLGGSHIGLKGFEIGFLWNHKSEFVDGIQIALGANITEGPLDGVQIALVNIANQDSKGLQLGLTNFSDDLNGLQLGLFNFGARTDVQIGIINIAEKSEFSLGIFNLNWAYALHPIFWLESDEQLTLGVEHGGEHIKYSLLASLYLPSDAIQIGGGLGYHTSGKYFFSGDLFAFQILFIRDEIWRLSLNIQAKVSVGYRFSDRFAIFGGASVNGLISSLSGADRIFPDASIIALNSQRRLYLWPNLHVGMSF